MLEGWGTIPDTRDSLMMAVMVGIKSSRHSCTRYVGTGSSMHDFSGALRMMFFTCCSVTRENVSRVGPQKTEKSGCLDVACSSLSLWILVEKKYPNISGRYAMMSKRCVFVKDLSQTRVVAVKEVRTVKLKGTNICLESI